MAHSNGKAATVRQMADQASKTLSVREVRVEYGFDLQALRALEAQGLIAVEWTGPRSGRVWREDLEDLEATRLERATERSRDREQRRVAAASAVFQDDASRRTDLAALHSQRAGS